MADEPRIVIEFEPEGDPGGSQGGSDPRGSGAPAGDDWEHEGENARRAVFDAHRRATAWFNGFYPGHGNAIFFGIVGVVAAILIFCIGFFQTLFMVLLGAVGVAFGQYLDGDPKLWRAVTRIFNPNDNG